MQLVFCNFLLYLREESLSQSDKPQTWDVIKLIMRETFINPPSTLNSYNKVHHLEEESVVVPLAMTNLLQDSEQMQQDKDDTKKMRISQPHVPIQNHHLTIHLVLLLKMRAKVMRGKLHSRMVRLLLMC